MELKFDQDRKLFFDSFPSWKTFQTFPDNKNIKSQTNLTRQVSLKENQYPIDGDINPDEKIIPYKIIAGLDKLNDLGAGIFMTINETDGRGRKQSNVTKVRSCFADFDGTDLPSTFDERPSMIVETSPGNFHVYYFAALEDRHSVPLQAFKTLQQSIAHRFNSDPKVCDLPRVMRIPGFYHRKKEPFLSHVVDYTGTRFTFGLLVELFPPLPVKQWSAEKWQNPIGQGKVTGEYKGQYGSSKGNRNCDLAKIIGGMLKNGRDWGYIEAECYKHNAYSHPPLSENEVKAVLKSCRRYT